MLTDEIIWCPKFQNNQVKWGGAINETRLTVSQSLLKQDNSYTSLCYSSVFEIFHNEKGKAKKKSKKQENKQSIDTDITSLTLKIRKTEA